MISKLIKTPEQEIFNRINTLKENMAKSGYEAVFLSHKPDIYYFSGTAQDSYLYIHIEQDPILFVKRYFPRAQRESCLSNIIQISSVKKIPEKINDLHPNLPKSCGLAFDVVPVRDFYYYRNLFGSVSFIDCSPDISKCRQIKSDWEIIQMQKAAELSKKTFSYIEKHIRPGISEMEFCGEYETFARKFGHSGLMITRHYRSDAFPFHLLSGKTGGLPGAVDTPCCGTGTSIAQPFGAGPKKIKKNEPVLIDLGTLLNGYHMDETRMFALQTMPEKAMDASKAALEILHSLLPMMQPGVMIGDLYAKSLVLAKKLGYEDQFLGFPGAKSIFIGHGIGLEIVEFPIISHKRKELLQPGMVLAFEPKLVFENEFAAGVESVVHITDSGARFLSSTPHEIFVC